MAVPYFNTSASQNRGSREATRFRQQPSRLRWLMTGQAELCTLSARTAGKTAQGTRHHSSPSSPDRPQLATMRPRRGNGEDDRQCVRSAEGRGRRRRQAPEYNATDSRRDRRRRGLHAASPPSERLCALENDKVASRAPGDIGAGTGNVEVGSDQREGFRARQPTPNSRVETCSVVRPRSRACGVTEACVSAKGSREPEKVPSTQKHRRFADGAPPCRRRCALYGDPAIVSNVQDQRPPRSRFEGGALISSALSGPQEKGIDVTNFSLGELH